MLTRFKQIFSHHKTLVLSFVFFFVFSGVLSVFAAAPSGGYAPNATLDPDCAPGDTDCVVTTGWEFDTVNNYVFNDTDLIGIGTDTPSVELHVVGDINQASVLPSGGLGSFTTGDLTAVGGVEGYNMVVVDSLLTPTAIGGISLNLNTNEPRVRMQTFNVAYENYIDFQTTGGGNIEIARSNLGNLSAQGMVIGDTSSLLGTEGMYFYNFDNPLNPTKYSLFSLDIDQISLLTTGTNFSLYPSHNLSPVDQHFSLSANPLSDPTINVGFEAQEDNDGLKAKVFYATALTNLNVIEVGPNNVSIFANDHNQITVFDQNGIEFFDGITTEFSVDTTGQIFSDALSGGATTLETDANGNIIRTPSDEKLKTDIETMTDNLARVLALNPVSYNWKDVERFGGQRQMGFIAQELELVVPEVVRSGGEYKSVNYQILTSLLAGAIQELDIKLIGIQNLSDETFLSRIRNWFADAGNGIGDFIAGRVRTQTLCVGVVGNETCITKDQLDSLLNNQNIQANQESQENQIIPNESAEEIAPEDPLLEEQSVVEETQEGSVSQEQSEPTPVVEVEEVAVIEGIVQE